MPQDRMNKVLLILAGWALTGCVYVFTPRTVTHYDEDCKDVFREMKLTVEQMNVMPGGGCSGERECLGFLAALALITPASAIVSGSIVVVGNTVFWIEKQGKCLGKDQFASASH